MKRIIIEYDENQNCLSESPLDLFAYLRNEMDNAKIEATIEESNIEADGSSVIDAKELPPDPDGENDNRALWAEKAIFTFRRITNTEPEDAVCDLLCDLMHFCDRDGQTFSRELARAQEHYTAETAKEGHL